MIKVVNPENGASIKDRYTLEGKILALELPVGKTVMLPDEVGNYLLEKYGFLDKSDELVPEMKVDGLIYCKNNCGYGNKYKVGVLQHEKSCKFSEVEVKEVQPISVVKDDQTMVSYAPAPGMDSDGVEWVGNGLEEDRSPMGKARPLNTLGNFGAA